MKTKDSVEVEEKGLLLTGLKSQRARRLAWDGPWAMANSGRIIG